MGYYYIRNLPWKKSLPHWKLQFISFKKDDFKDSTAKKPKKEWDIEKQRLPTLGFHYAMSIEDARVRAKQLNLQRHLKEQEKQIQEMLRAEWEQQRKNADCLPPEFVTEFEARFIRTRDRETINCHRKTSRAKVIWHAAQRAIIAVRVDPTDWFYHTLEIYDHFFREQLSIRYIQVILKLMNLWGYFISRKLAHPFLPIPVPKGYERGRLIEENYRKDSTSVSRASLALAPSQLNLVQKKMNTMDYNWLFLSIWFGLRPQEIDNLHNPDIWKTEILPNGRCILWVFQTKIIALPLEDRWKPIPLLFPEPQYALKILREQRFRRPLPKTMRKIFGRRTTLYGGRKGFTDLMLSLGQSLENISIWMGHSTLDRTWKSYKNRTKFHLQY